MVFRAVGFTEPIPECSHCVLGSGPGRNQENLVGSISPIRKCSRVPVCIGLYFEDNVVSNVDPFKAGSLVDGPLEGDTVIGREREALDGDLFVLPRIEDYVIDTFLEHGYNPAFS